MAGTFPAAAPIIEEDTPEQEEPKERLCACGCGRPIPAYYHPNAQYITGHKKKAARGELGSLGVDIPGGGSGKGSPELSRRARKPPNFSKIFARVDSIANKVAGTEKGLWKLERDEVSDLNEAWIEMIGLSEESMMVTKGLNWVATAALIVSIGAIFAPRIAETATAYLHKVKEVQSPNGRSSGDTGEVARADSQTGSSNGAVRSTVLRPWDDFAWDTETSPSIAAAAS